jgi:hypothetical protein
MFILAVFTSVYIINVENVLNNVENSVESVDKSMGQGNSFFIHHR